MGYKSTPTWEPELGDYITGDGLNFYDSGISKEMIEFLHSDAAVLRLTDVYYGGRASPSVTAEIGEASFSGYHPNDVSPYMGDNPEEAYSKAVETYNRLAQEWEAEKARRLEEKERKELLRLLEKYGVPEVFNGWS